MFITFEGIDGSGKSTQVRRLAQRLEEEGYTPLTVREPGGTEVSERIRSVLLDPDLHIVPMAELLLFSAARAQLVEERLRPALRKGSVVVSDRFYDSTVAYQSAGRELETTDWLAGFNQRVTGGLTPDRTYLIKLTPSLARERGAGQPRDRMEGADLAFYRRVAAAYEALAEAEPERFCRLDGQCSIEALHENIWADLQPRLCARHGTRISNGSSS